MLQNGCFSFPDGRTTDHFISMENSWEVHSQPLTCRIDSKTLLDCKELHLDVPQGNVQIWIVILSKNFYRTRVRSLGMLFTNWLTDSLNDSCLVILMWPWHVKMTTQTCWGCYCCSCWWWETCWQQFGTDLESEVWS